MDLGLVGRTYVVTGGTAGLGLATARALVGEGARVVVTSRAQEKVEAAVEELGGPDVAVGFAADNADPRTARRLVVAAEASFGRLDGALVSVGGPPPARTMDATDEQWQEAFSSVFLGAVRIAREVGRAVADTSRTDEPAAADAGGDRARGRGAAIVLVLSSTVRRPIPDLAISNGLRPGLAMVVTQLAADLGPADVRVLGLLPGTFLTDRVAETTPDAADRARAAAEVPLRRAGDPDELGRVAAFLLSPAASFVTGTHVVVDGGALQVV